MDLDVIENGMPPERPRPRHRLILTRIAVAVLVLAGVGFAVSRHRDATSQSAPPVAAPTPAATPPDQDADQGLSYQDNRPFHDLPAGLLDKAQRMLAAPPDAPKGAVELRGSDFQGGAGGVGLFDESVTVPGPIRVDVICLGTGLARLTVQDGTQDNGPTHDGLTEVDCAVGKILTNALTTAGKGFYVYAQPAPDTVAVLAYAIRLT